MLGLIPEGFVSDACACFHCYFLTFATTQPSNFGSVAVSHQTPSAEVPGVDEAQ